jgi:hypothetical protein
VATIRFAIKAPLPSSFLIDSVPAQFTRFVCDIDESQDDGAARIGRMRYIGQAYNVIELGPIDGATV